MAIHVDSFMAATRATAGWTGACTAGPTTGEACRPFGGPLPGVDGTGGPPFMCGGGGGGP
jgi:hypothetical protein